LRVTARLNSRNCSGSAYVHHIQRQDGNAARCVRDRSLKAEIKYGFEELERGGRVSISTNNPEAVKAIYEVLRFQIKDHQTGDSGEIEN
jgi:hypothetical protein